MTVSELEQFTAWIEDVIRRRGYDIDSPRGGGKSRLADEAGVHRAAITRLLQRQSMPDLETMRRLAHVLGIPVREMLIRSGRLTEDELPMPPAADDPDRQNAGSERITLEEAAAALGVPADQREMFMRVAGQFLPADPVDQDFPARRTRRG
ncbi:helix-turn-helix transcriptional regulator [Streptomyces sp. B1I3]|uniref:helix-turn-helix domain-containing protein n=1 Tax=Streptomyces sp. B1I3 TaxID=3042264 RepID=UPI00277E8580|nr:helix-turn-helix transcriptional regulator [Streptomyces sp. B1I3]MDQ0794570.1 transcriptional regulator with XRE-family HTH domain [Streptomyces sp. B1I3]